MKTIEFKLYLTRSQTSTIDNWLAALKYPWNKGVELIKRFNEFNHYDKRFKSTAPCCPVASYNHTLRITNAKNREPGRIGLRENEYLSCPIGWELDDYTEFHCSTETKELHQDIIEENKVVAGVNVRSPLGIFPVRPHQGGKLVTNLTYFGLLPVFAHKRNTDKPWLTEVDSKFVAGTVKMLADAWVAFLEGNCKSPKFKGKKQRIDTLIHNNSKEIRVEGDRIKIPKIGWVKAKGLSKRWPKGVPFCPMKICRKASGYYLQLSGNIDVNESPRPKLPAVGLDPGIEVVYTDDAGRRVKVPSYLEKDLWKLKDLQRKAQRQWDANQGSDNWERRNWRKTQNKIAKLHEKIARRGRAFNHFESTKLVRQFENIYLEDYRPSEIVGRLDAVDSGKMVVNKNQELTTIYEKNGQKIQQSINRAQLRNRVGQLWQMIETKGGKRVVRVERDKTSSECPNCGDIKEKPLKKRIHRCEVCGYTTHRDRAAAQVIKKRGQAVTVDGCLKGKSKKKRKPKSA